VLVGEELLLYLGNPGIEQADLLVELAGGFLEGCSYGRVDFSHNPHVELLHSGARDGLEICTNSSMFQAEERCQLPGVGIEIVGITDCHGAQGVVMRVATVGYAMPDIDSMALERVGGPKSKPRNFGFPANEAVGLLLWMVLTLF